MPDAQSRSSFNEAATHPPDGMTKWSGVVAGYIVLVALVAAVVIPSVPALRGSVAELYAALVGAEEAALEVEAVQAEDGSDPKLAPKVAHSHTVAFLGSMGNGQVTQKLPVVKVSTVQSESLGRYIARKYRVSAEATRMLISTAYGVGQEMGLDPLLLLAVIAIESGFNPFAESHVGAQGLMQVMTRVHIERFRPFGGEQAAWNPVANIRVGASILKEYIDRGGSLTAGLRMYVGVGPDGSSPYGDKVLAERRRLASAAGVSADLPGVVAGKPQPARSASATPAPMPMPNPPSDAVSVKNPDAATPAVM